MLSLYEFRSGENPSWSISFYLFPRGWWSDCCVCGQVHLSCFHSDWKYLLCVMRELHADSPVEGFYWIWATLSSIWEDELSGHGLVPFILFLWWVHFIKPNVLLTLAVTCRVGPDNKPKPSRYQLWILIPNNASIAYDRNGFNWTMFSVKHSQMSSNWT